MTTRTENLFLTELIKDCITYNLKEQEALAYIETRFRKISLDSYRHRKCKTQSDASTNLWLNHFTRIGFITNQKKQIETIQKVQQDSLRQLLIETSRRLADRNEDIILKLKSDIRENTKLLSELSLGMPIISAIKAKLEEKNKNEMIQR